MTENESRTHVLNRAATILEAVASAGVEGVRLLDLAEATGISRPTVHRILGSLREIGYVRQLENKRYTLGARLGLLGLAAPSPLQYTSELQKIAQDLADKLGDTVYIAMRYFDSVYYLARAHGGFPVRMQTVEVGDVLPMSATYSGIALLSQLDPERRAQMIDNLPQAERLEWSEIGSDQHRQLIVQAIDEFRVNGYLYGDDYVLPGLSGAATLIPVGDGSQVMALSVSAIHSRLPEARRDSVIRAMHATGRRIQSLLRQ